MGEKTGALTIMVTVLVVAVAIILIVQTTMPDLVDGIIGKMSGIVENVDNTGGSNAGNVGR